MRQMLFLGLTFVLCMGGSVNAQITRERTPMGSPTIINFQRQLQEQLRLAEAHVKELSESVQSRSLAPAWTNKVEFQNALIMLNVKKTLVANFSNNPVIQSERMRGALLSLLQQDSITEADLIFLQNVANEERVLLNLRTTPPEQWPPEN